MAEIEQLADFDLFFYYGDNNLDLETQSDVLQVVVQPRRRLFYDRSNGAGIEDLENPPNNTLLDVAARFEVAAAVARRNLEVSSGESGTPDRRVATSQAVIEILRSRNAMDVAVLYVPFADHETQRSVTASVGIR